MTDPVREVVDQHYAANKKALAAAAEVENLAAELKIVLSEQIVAARRMEVAEGGKKMSLEEAEHHGRISAEYGDVFSRLCAARKIAAEFEAEADYLDRRWQTWRTRSADRRASGGSER